MIGDGGKSAIRRLRAHSISKSLRARLPGVPASGSVLAAFRRVCIVQYGQDDLLALVAPNVGNGPLNAVVGHIPEAWSVLRPGMPAQVQGSVIQLGGWEVDLDGAETWDPRPNWDRLRLSSGVVLGRLGWLLNWAVEHASRDSLLALCDDWGRPGVLLEGMIQARAQGAAEAMWEGWQGDDSELRAGAACFAGLGSGLTPAGDDFVLGTMLCAWLTHPNPNWYCDTVAEVSSPKTTMLSRVFLQVAAAGEFGAPWHCLLDALQDGSDEQVEAATRQVLAFGHSSGADALAGFLFVGRRVAKDLKGDQCL